MENSPGDPSWCGSDHSLKKISKAGKISVAKHNICFWPIGVFVSDRCKRAEAVRWNRTHAQIEVKKIKNVAEVAAFFEGQAEVMDERISWDVRRFGEDHPDVVREREMKAHYLSVAEAVRKGER